MALPAMEASVPTSPRDQSSMPNTPAFPPSALYQPRSRPLSYSRDPSRSDLPLSPTSPSALPDYPPTPGLTQTMSGFAQHAEEEVGGAPASRAAPSSQETHQDPSNPAPQQHYMHDGEEEQEEEDGGGNGEQVWSPAHPCFPHPNPHVPLSSPLYDTTRIIRIPRDWMAAGDLYPAFTTTYPEILMPWVSEESFRSLVGQLNDALRVAFEPATKKAVLEGLLGLFSGWLLEDVGAIGPKRQVKYVEAIIDNWNAQRGRHGEYGANKGLDDTDGDDLVRVVPLRRTAYMSLDIQIPDPKIQVVEQEHEGRSSEHSSRRASRAVEQDAGGDDDANEAEKAYPGGMV